jgi:transposase InsO family protein
MRVHHLPPLLQEPPLRRGFRRWQVLPLTDRQQASHQVPRAPGDAVELATLQWVHWFNHQRLHSTLGGIPPFDPPT